MIARARDDVSWPALILLVLLGLTPLVVQGVSAQGVVIIAMIYAVGAVGLDLLTGYSGQFSFGQFVYFATGAYVMTTVRNLAHWPWVPALLLAVAASAALAALVGAMLVRLAFFGVAVGTFFLGAAAVDLLNGQRLARWTGGSNGIGVLPVSIGAHSLTAGNGLYYASLIGLAVVMALCLRYTKIRAGLASRVIKENEIVAAVMGIRVFREKVRAQAIAGLTAGLGGCLLAMDIGYLSPDSFNVTQSIELFAIVAVGGTGSLVGPVIGALFFFSLVNGLSSTSSASQLVFALVLLAVVVLFNRGLYDLLERLARWLWHRWRALIRRPAGPSAGRPAEQASASDASSTPMPAATSKPGQPPYKAPIGAVAARADAGAVALAVRPTQVQAASEPAGAPLLVIDGASVDFGGVSALDGVCIDVFRGEVHAVIGPNGAGKTTLLNCVSGIQPMTGTVALGEQSLSGLTVSARRGRGIARTFQHPSLVADLDVLHNVMVGAFERHTGSIAAELFGLPRSRRLRRVARERAIEALRRLDFPEARWRVPAGDLSMGEQKQVDIARAIASEPQVLLLDEPTAGLGIEEMGAVAHAIESVRDAGVTVVVIAHHVGFIRQIASRCTVLDFGRVLVSGTVTEALADPRVIEVFVGSGDRT